MLLKDLVISAAQGGHLDSIKHLVSSYRSIDTDILNSALVSASGKGHLDVVKFLLSIPNVNPATSENLPIKWACAHGHLNVAKFLASIPGVDPSENGDALIWSAVKGKLDIVKFLVSIPSVNALSVINNLIIELVCRNNLNVAKFLITLSPNGTPKGWLRKTPIMSDLWEQVVNDRVNKVEISKNVLQLKLPIEMIKYILSYY